MRKALPIFVAVGRMFSISPLKTMSSMHFSISSSSLYPSWRKNLIPLSS